MSAGLKSIKGGKTEIEPAVITRTFRGTEFAITEISVTEYKDLLKSAQREDGTTPFGDLLDLMVMRCVSPSPASFAKPLPYPVYRTLEAIVNDMHFLDVAEDPKPEPTEEEPIGEAAAPNS